MDNTIAKDTTDKPVAKNETKEKLEKTDRKKSSGNGKLKAGMAVFLIGIATLVAGVVLLVINLVAKPAVRDADYLVSVGKWELEDDSNCASEKREYRRSDGKLHRRLWRNLGVYGDWQGQINHK